MNEIVTDLLANIGLSWWQALMVALGGGAVGIRAIQVAWWTSKRLWSSVGTLTSLMIPGPSRLALEIIREVSEDPTVLLETVIPNSTKLKCRKVVVKFRDSDSDNMEVIIRGNEEAHNVLSDRDLRGIHRAALARKCAIESCDAHKKQLADEEYRQRLLSVLQD